ncbi:MAG TPA: hypothetical protein PLV65_07920 [Tenuifilaceae bacterium]|nr:hypothetical protein [Tenuifilaceae bacterium]
METLKLVLATLGVLIIIVGFFFVAFTLLGKNKSQGQESCNTDEQTRSFGCGCGSGACGLPVDRQ